MRLYASAANGRKNGKNRATVNNNNTNNNTNNTGSPVKKFTPNASVKAVQPNFPNKQQTQEIKTQSTTNVDDKNEKSTAKISDLKILMENAQNKPNDNGKPPVKIVNVTIFWPL